MQSLSSATFGPIGTIPAERGALVGRQTEVRELEDLLESARVVSIVGPGGVGKTRLAVDVATRLSDATPGGIWFVDLAPLRDPDLLADTVAAAMRHVADGRVASMQASVARFIGTERALLVLDNCEHVLAACSEFCEALVRACPRLRILATSRERLDLAGERVLPLGPLSVRAAADQGGELPAAVALFVARATEVVPDFAPDDVTLGVIGEICELLDGLPLAIELAAARLPVLSVQQLRERTSNRILSRAPRNAPPRHRTLVAAIEWSYDLCSPSERLLWSRMTVFAGGCELDAAEVVCAGNGIESSSVLDLLQSLVEKSIVVRSQRDGATWFSMLTTFHEFGGQILADSGEFNDRMQRCADWYVLLMQRAEREWIGPEQPYWTARMYRELVNLRPLLRYGLSTGGEAGASATLAMMVAGWWACWYMVGRQHEELEWLDQVLQATPHDHVLRARALAVRAYLQAHLSPDSRPLPAALADLDAARAASTLRGDREVLVFVDFVGGVVADSTDQPQLAVEAFERALAAATEDSDTDVRIWALVELAGVARMAGDNVRAQTAYEEARRLCLARGAVYEPHLAAFVLALANWRCRDYVGADALYRRALALTRPLNNPMSVAICVDMVGCGAAVVRSDFRLAAYLGGAATMLWRRAGTDPSAFALSAMITAEVAASVRTQLGDSEYATWFARGRAADPEAAVGIALGRELQPPPSSAILTRREGEVARLIADGLTNRMIAERFFLSVRTVEGHVERIRSKLGVNSRVQIAIWMMQPPRP